MDSAKEIRVLATVGRRMEQETDENYRQWCHAQEWEIPIVGVIFNDIGESRALALP